MNSRRLLQGAVSPGLVLGVLILVFASVYLIRSVLVGEGGRQGGYPPTPVQLVELKEEPFAERVSLLGEVRSKSDSTVRSEVDGVVSQILVDVGDSLQPGQVVAYLEGTEQQIALAEAEARLAEGRSRLAELENGTRPEILAQRESEWRAAQASEREAEAYLQSVKRLAPQLLQQRRGEYQSAQASERDAADQYQRTVDLVRQGALPDRDLVSVEATWDRMKGELLRAEQALSAQQTSNQRDELTAQAQLESARASSLRSQAAFEEARAGVRQEVVEAQRGVVQALQAARDRAALDYERTAVRSRALGNVRERLVGRGDRVSVDSPLLTLAGAETDLFFEIPQELMGSVKPGAEVLLQDRSTRASVVGLVEAVTQAADPRSRRQSIRVKTTEGSFLPGTSVEGQLLLPVQGDYLVAPRDALVQRERGWVVFTVNEESEAVEHDVELVAEQGLQVAVRGEDLIGGQKVVGRGAPGLMDGASVAVPQAENQAAPPRPEQMPTEGQDS